ncbi:uncharacterized protein GGS25DRAFT_42187 [Hypoxylon fragiforme]|uniref:uncharacterized protein n=1 Tax=Hypoxylon fragiforme TaxID=63214 RepID=UPI0020C6AAF7|nr:uncharacterized protein GGS25DRAFT_42187 [Hypoxylon fragiforme]KAI2614261.1 hypothetical protein GGS25DRAFT_42187 [Hypoxylon fragiforme]
MEPSLSSSSFAYETLVEKAYHDSTKSSPLSVSNSSYGHLNQAKHITMLTRPQLKSALSKAWEAISIAHLITESNIKSYVQPVALFAILSVASGRVTTNPNPTWADLITIAPRATLYVWLFVFYADCSNQKDPSSVEEDRLNKPWRAIPSGRLTIEGAEKFYIASIILLLLSSGLWLGGFPEAVIFLVEIYVHDYASGNISWWSKNAINILFYLTAQIGATRVAAESLTSNSMSRAGYEWCALLGLQTFTTIQIQDLRDQEGDSIRGRRTMPIAIGDVTTRWITAFFITFWSIACPTYWEMEITAGHVLPLLIGGAVSAHVLLFRTPKSDRFSFHYYTLLWLPSLYAIPLLSQYKLI